MTQKIERTLETMNGVILIGHKDQLSMDLIRTFIHPGQVDYYDLAQLNQITVDFGDGQFYYIESTNLQEEFEPEELTEVGIPLEQLNFILLNYDTFARLKQVLLTNEDKFSEDIWLDNDRGLLKPVKDFLTQFKEKPKWKW